jgi:hypothetical protein
MSHFSKRKYYAEMGEINKAYHEGMITAQQFNQERTALDVKMGEHKQKVYKAKYGIPIKTKRFLIKDKVNFVTVKIPKHRAYHVAFFGAKQAQDYAKRARKTAHKYHWDTKYTVTLAPLHSRYHLGKTRRVR